MSSEEELEAEVVEDENPSLDRDLLIELIQQYEYLYNLGHRDYKNQQKKELAWKEIADTLTSTVPMCRKEWKNLRDRFNKENKTRSGAKAPASKWAYYSAMLFYGKYCKPRKTSTSVKQSTAVKSGTSTDTETRPSSSCSSVWSTVDTILSPEPPDATEEAEESTGTRNTERSTSETRSVERSNSEAREIPEIKSTPTCSRKRLKKDADITEVVQLAKKIAGQVEGAQGRRQSCNNTFVEYVLTRLNEMSPEEAQEKRKNMLLVLEG